MGWTAPRDWTVGEIVTEAMMDTHIKDNLRYLKGLDGVITTQSGLIIDSALGTEYLQIPSLTTGERDALSALNGMVIYNETTGEFNKYEAGAWKDLGGGVDHGGLDGLADDDHTQYILHSLTTTRGDVITRGAAANQRLALGTSGQYLSSNGTDVVWASGVGGLAIFGDSSDGDVTISEDTTLSRDMFYDNLTVNTGIVLTTAGYRIFVKGTLTNNGTIANDGTSGGAAGAAGSLGGGGAGQNGNGTGVSPGLGGNGGAGSGTTGGAVTAPTGAQGGYRALPFAILLKDETSEFGGGGGGGGDAGTNNGGGGGGIVLIVAAIITNTSGIIRANGGNGASAGTGTGGGGGGGVVLIYNSLTTGTEQANGGAAHGTGSAGSAGIVVKIAHA